MHRALIFGTLVIALASLPGCHGSDDDEQESNFLIPQGLWTSTAFNLFAMVDPNGFTVLIDGNFTPGNTPDPGFDLYRGDWFAHRVTGVIEDQMLRIIDGLPAMFVDFEAIHVPRSSIIGTLTHPAVRVVDLRWDPLSDRNASIARITGAWTALGGIRDLTLNVSGDGSLSGSDNSGCTYQGRLFVERSDTNVYFVRMRQFCGLPFDLVFEGLAAVMRSGTDDDVLLLATSAIVLFGNDHSIIEVMQR